MQLLPKKDVTPDLSVPGYKPRIVRGEYEKKQELVKDQIMATQRKSVSLRQLEKTYLIQSGGAVLASVVLVILFIFVMFPTMIRFAGNIKGLSALTKSDKIPPRVPVYTAPPIAIQDPSYDLSGFGEASSEVVLIKNGQEASRTQANETGEFTLTLNLDDGDNTFSLYSIDGAKNESNVTKQFVIKKDNEAPELTIESPEDQKTITSLSERTIEVKGKVSEQSKVSLNEAFVAVGGDGTFTTNFTLNDGKNELNFKAVDDAGNITEEKRTVNYKN